MKIVCESCSAKYSIADEKVAGRVFKIRCKKCGAAIVVRGDEVDDGGSAGDEQPTRVVDYGGEAVWHIVVEGEQQGPYAPAQLGEMLSAGTLTWDAYVWREGYEDWKPAQDIEELVAAIMGGSGGVAQSDAGAAPSADPFAAAPAAAPSAAVARGSDAGADLFAQSEAASPFGARGDDEEDVVASAPSPRVSAEQSLTGARNENSVLFSLSNLQALATGGGGGGAAPSSPSPGPSMSSMAASSGPAPRAGHATGEGSGLIDIRALAGATGVTGGGSGPVTSKKADRVDDLLSIGGAGAGGLGLGSSLGAPVLMPEKKEESNKGLIIGITAAAAVAIAAAAAVVIVVIVNDDDPQPPVASVGDLQTGQTVNANPTAPTGPGAGTPTAGTEPPASGEQPTAAESGEQPDEEGQATGRPSSGNRPRSGARREGGAETGGPAAPAERPSRDTNPSSREATGGGDIDDLLNSALGEGGGGGRPARPAAQERPAPAGGGSGPPTPSRGDIVSAMNSVSGAVSSCGAGQHGIANVRIVFSGSTGRVTNATVAGGSFPAPVASCIARAARGARVPQFQQPTFSVNYPFRL